MKTYSILLSSSPTQGAKNVSPDGSSFEVFLDNAIFLKGREQSEIYVHEASIWYTSPNITTSNNKLYIAYGAVPVNYVLTFDTGLYSFSALSSQLQVLLANAGIPNILTLIANDSTQKAGFTFNDSDISLDFTGDLTHPDNIGNIVGFTTASIITALNGQTVYGNDIARFNQLQYYLITCSLVKTGLPINNQSKKIIAKIVPPLGTQVGSQIPFLPVRPVYIRDDSLLNKNMSNFSIQLLDQDGVPINTLGESYSLILSFRYK